MAKKAYISIEGNQAKILLKKNSNVKKVETYTLPLEILQDFIKKEKIKEAIIAQFIPNLINFQFSIPFSEDIKRKRKVLNGIVMAEIRKRYPSMENFSFLYNVHEKAGRVFLRCYIVEEEGLQLLNKLILQGINIKAFYPLFLPLVEFFKAKGDFSEPQLICLFSDNLRMLFVLGEEELILQRTFEAEHKVFNEEDIVNINMTISYSIQNFRIKPEKVLLIGIEKQEISGLTVPFEFIDFPEELKDHTICLFLSEFESKLKGREMFSPEYKRYLQTKKPLNYVAISLSLVAVLLALYNFRLIDEIFSYRETFNSYRKEINAKERDFFLFQDNIKNFEKTLKPYLELQNKLLSYDDIRASFEPIQEVSRIKGVEINSIDIENGKIQKIKISGKIAGMSFADKQMNFMELKNIASIRGLKITNEKWDFMKGEFNIEGEYDSQRVLQR